MKAGLAIAGAAAVLIAGSVGWWVWAGHDGARADPDDARQVASGSVIYETHCAACHGARLEGQPDWQRRRPDGRLPAPPHDATGHTWHHPDAVLFAVTKHGVAAVAPPSYQSDMPAFAAVLRDDEIRAVIAFIKSRWPVDIRSRQAALDAQTKR